MSSDMSHPEYKQYQISQLSSPGLSRFRSAPGSLLANFSSGIDKCGGDAPEIFSGHQSSSLEAEGLTSGFNSCGGNINSVTQTFHHLEEGKPLSNGYSLSSQLTTQYQRQGSSAQWPSLDCTYGVATSVAMDHHAQTKMGTNLPRQSSSPAGLFSHLSVHNGYAAMRVVGNYRAGNGSNGEISPSSSRLKGQTNFSSGVPSALGLLSRISEVEGENIGASDHDDEKLSNDNGNAQFYGSGYSFSSWNDSSHFAENLSGLKRNLDGDVKLFSGTQDGELKNGPHLLSHHLSLPRTPAEVATMEKLLQFQDSVPCKIRAKRGCATHPRSIAERVRRTRISERMRKLQELVPSMDKQTNTADMLDLAVEYIKDLQSQYKTLSENRANCKCSSMQKPVPNQAV